MFIRILLLFSLCFPSFCLAESTIQCHCFQDRLFNHRDTSAADPYFLATTQNSFISQIFNVEKRSLVKEKMSGVSGDQLWIRYDVAARSQQKPERIAAMFNHSKSWRKVLRELSLGPEELGGDYWDISENPEQLADLIADRQLVSRLGADSDRVRQWRAAGMSRKEMLLAFLLKGDPVELYQQVRSGRQTWGQLLFLQGYLDGAAIKKLISKKLAMGG